VIDAFDDPRDECAIVFNQTSLHAALGAVAKRIERRAPQSFHAREDLERREHPATQLALLRPAAQVAAGHQRRREVERHPEISGELRAHALHEARV
jgi:hypothetical protein